MRIVGQTLQTKRSIEALSLRLQIYIFVPSTINGRSIGPFSVAATSLKVVWMVWRVTDHNPVGVSPPGFVNQFMATQ